jgi:hypothetical protein
MYLIHTTDENNILKILEDGKLKSSSNTKNVRLYGKSEGSKYIYLRLGKKNDYANFVLDKKLLLENVFYLQTGWSAIPLSEKIDGKTLSENQLDEILKKFNENVNNYIKDNKKNIGFTIQMSNEIIIKNNIDLKKYLKKVNISKYDKKIDNFLKNNYPNTNLFY